MRKMIWVLLAVTAASWLSAQTAPAPPAVPAVKTPVVPKGGGIGLISRGIPDAAAVERGKAVFVGACSFCHGSDAKGGDGGPDLVRSVTVLRDEGGNLIGPVVMNGRGAMPKVMLSREQVSDVAAFLRYQTQLTIDRRTYELENVAKGDARAGESFFRGAGGCARCHATSPQPGPEMAANLAGIGSRYDVPTLRSQIAYPNLRSAPGFDRGRVRATVTQADGVVFAGIVEYQDDFDVRVRDAAGTRQTFPRKGPAKVEIVDPLAAHEENLYKLSDAQLQDVTAFLWGLK